MGSADEQLGHDGEIYGPAGPLVTLWRMGVTEADGARLEGAPVYRPGRATSSRSPSSTIVYGLSGVLLQAVGIVTLPIFARAFTQVEYGKLELGLVLSSVTLTIVDLGFASAAQRSFYDYTDSRPTSGGACCSRRSPPRAPIAIVGGDRHRGAARRARRLDLRRL